MFKKYIKLDKCTDNDLTRVEGAEPDPKVIVKQIKKEHYKGIADGVPSTVHVNYQCEHRRLFESSQKLERTCQLARQRKKVLTAKWRQLETNEESFKAMFSEYEKFLQQNHDKSVREHEKKVHNRKKRKILELQTKDLKEKILGMTEAARSMEEKIRDYRIYTDFLIEIKSLLNYKSIDEIINKYDELSDVREQLAIKYADEIRETNQKGNEYKIFMETSLVTTNSLSAALSELHKRYKDTITRSLKAEILIKEIYDQQSLQYERINTAKTAIQIMYGLMNNRKQDEDSDADEIVAPVTIDKKLTTIKRILGIISTGRIAMEQLNNPTDDDGILAERVSYQSVVQRLLTEIEDERKAREAAMEIEEQEIKPTLYTETFASCAARLTGLRNYGQLYSNVLEQIKEEKSLQKKYIEGLESTWQPRKQTVTEVTDSASMELWRRGKGMYKQKKMKFDNTDETPINIVEGDNFAVIYTDEDSLKNEMGTIEKKLATDRKFNKCQLPKMIPRFQGAKKASLPPLKPSSRSTKAPSTNRSVRSPPSVPPIRNRKE